MTDKLIHESLYRGPTLATLRGLSVVVCGAGAIGSHLADNLARQGFGALRAIDRDRVEAHNAGTQLYGESEAGVWKVEALRNRVFRGAGVEVDAVRKEMTAANAVTLLRGASVVVDSFDNAASRQIVQDACRTAGLPCLHVGLNADYAEVLWDEGYRVPRDVAAGDACAYPLARNLVLLAVAVASEALVTFALGGRREQWSVTLRDLAIRPAEMDEWSTKGAKEHE